MACINKSNPKYKVLQGRYGDFLAESFVRSNILNKKLNNFGEFYIPTQGEITEYYRTVKKPLKQKEIEDALKLNPLLSLNGIKTILQGVIRTYDNKLYITKGSDHRGPIEQGLTLREIYEPNLKIMQALASQYPKIFTLKDGVAPNTKVVTITPATEVDYVPEIQKSLDVYEKLLIDNEGIQPNNFIVDDYFWQRIGNHTYILIDIATGDPFLRNINMNSGTEIKVEPTPVNKDLVEAEVMDIRANFDTEYWQIEFGLRGYNIEQIINNLEAAETQEEFDELLADFKKIVC